jgi:hypothetical protein
MARWIHLATRLGYRQKFAFLQVLLYRTAEENKVSWLFLPLSLPGAPFTGPRYGLPLQRSLRFVSS